MLSYCIASMHAQFALLLVKCCALWASWSKPTGILYLVQSVTICEKENFFGQEVRFYVYRPDWNIIGVTPSSLGFYCCLVGIFCGGKFLRNRK